MLSQLSVWYGSLGGIEIYKGDTAAGLANLAIASLCDFVGISVFVNRTRAMNFAYPLYFLSTDALKLARLISLGFFKEAKIIAEKLNGAIYRSEHADVPTQLAKFVLTLCFRSLEIPSPTVYLARPDLDFYRTILVHYLDEDPSACLSSALAESCEYHIEQSRDNTNSGSYDISDKSFQLYPAEILAVLRLREQRGLSQPSIDHSLMDMRTAKLHPIQLPATYPDFLVDIISKMKAAAPRFADGL